MLGCRKLLLVSMGTKYTSVGVPLQYYQCTSVATFLQTCELNLRQHVDNQGNTAC